MTSADDFHQARVLMIMADSLGMMAECATAGRISLHLYSDDKEIAGFRTVEEALAFIEGYKASHPAST